MLSNARGEWSLVSSLQCALLPGREQETSGEFQEQENRKIAKEVHGGLQFTLLHTVQNKNSAWKLWFPRGPAVTVAEVAAAAVLKTQVNLWRNAASKSCIVSDEFSEREVSAQFTTGSD